MKKYFLMLAVLLAGAVCFTSCGDDDENDIIGNTSCSIIEKGNQLIMKTVSPGIGTYTQTATFDEKADTCISFVEEEAFVSEALAKAEWDMYVAEMDEEDLANYSLKGKVITIIDDSMIGKSRQYIKSLFENEKALFEEDVRILGK